MTLPVSKSFTVECMIITLKKLVLACALLVPAFPAFAGPSQGGGDALEAQLDAAKDDALSAIQGISRTWGNTACGKLVEGRQKLLENLEIRPSLTSSDSPPLKRGNVLVMMTGSSRSVPDEKVRKVVRRVSILADRGEFAKRSSSEQERHDYAGLIAGFVFSDNVPDYDAAKCVIDYLRERDVIRKAGSPAAGQSGAGAAQ
jgi:hypothetical protein